MKKRPRAQRKFDFPKKQTNWCGHNAWTLRAGGERKQSILVRSPNHEAVPWALPPPGEAGTLPHSSRPQGNVKGDGKPRAKIPLSNVTTVWRMTQMVTVAGDRDFLNSFNYTFPVMSQWKTLQSFSPPPVSIFCFPSFSLHV